MDTRTQRMKKNSIVMFFVKGLSLLISLMYVPLMIGCLNTERYGIWLTLTSLTTWCSIMDLGLGHGLRNKLAESIALGRISQAKRYVSTAYSFIGLLIIVVVTLFLTISNKCINWQTVLNTTTLSNSEISVLVTIVFVSFAAHFVLNLINSINYAIQKPALSSIITTLGQLLSFLIVLLFARCWSIVDMFILIGVVSFVPVVVLGVSSLILFRSSYREISPSFRFIDKSCIKDILSVGLNFFIIQISTIVLYQTNNIIISNVLSPEYVTEYNIAYRYMNIVYSLYAIVITPVWSATTDAYAKGNYNWIHQSVIYSRKLFFIAAAVVVIFAISAPLFFHLWIGDASKVVHYTTTIALGAFVVTQMMYGIYGYIINGIGKLRLTVITNVLLMLLYVPTTYALGNSFGLIGICSTGVLVNLILYFQCKIQCNKLLKKEAVGIWIK